MSIYGDLYYFTFHFSVFAIEYIYVLLFLNLEQANKKYRRVALMLLPLQILTVRSNGQAHNRYDSCICFTSSFFTIPRTDN